MTLLRESTVQDEPRHEAGGTVIIDYRTDLHGWAMRQAALLKEKRFDLLDTENLADEVMDVAHRLAEKLESDLARILQHLLKWDHQAVLRSRSWALTIREHRRRVARHLRRGPSLRSALPETLAEAYESGRNAALAETDLPEHALPETCPYSWDEIMSRPIAWPEQP